MNLPPPPYINGDTCTIAHISHGLTRINCTNVLLRIFSGVAAANPCDPSPCQNDGTCNVADNGIDYTCTCVPWMTGKDCTERVVLPAAPAQETGEEPSLPQAPEPPAEALPAEGAPSEPEVAPVGESPSGPEASPGGLLPSVPETEGMYFELYDKKNNNLGFNPDPT